MPSPPKGNSVRKEIPRMENRVVVGCSSMEAYIAAAQKAADTDYPVVLIDRS